MAGPATLGALESLRYVRPEASLVVGAIAVLVSDLLVKRGRAFVVVLGLASLVTAAAFDAIALSREVPTTLLFGGQLSYDGYGCAFRLIFACVTAIALVASIATPEGARDGTSQSAGGELVLLLLVACLGMDLMATARSLLLVYLAIETVSVMSFVMAGLRVGTKREEARSSEAALKYVVFGGVSSGVMLYGMSWLYGLARSMSLPVIAERIALLTGDRGDVPSVVAIAVACVLAGFAYKISAVPFHMWAPDVYEGAPTLVAAFLSVGPKAAGLAVLVRFFEAALGAPQATLAAHSTPWPILAGVIAVATMTAGNLSALAQTNLKRMLAYSSVAHAGYMLLGFSLFTSEGVAAVAFYVVAYAAMNLGAFLIVMAVAEQSGGDETIDGIRGLGARSPAMAALMAIFLFSLVGLPPFAGFVGKVYLFSALLGSGAAAAYRGWYAMLAAAGVMNTVVSLFYYARVLRAMYLDAREPETEREARHETRSGKLPFAIAAMLALPTLGLGVYWGPVYDFLVHAVATVN